jgi:hypothetical protein
MLSLLSGYFQVPQPAKTIQNTIFLLSFGQICESNHNQTLLIQQQSATYVALSASFRV